MRSKSVFTSLVINNSTIITSLTVRMQEVGEEGEEGSLVVFLEEEEVPFPPVEA